MFKIVTLFVICDDGKINYMSSICCNLQSFLLANEQKERSVRLLQISLVGVVRTHTRVSSSSVSLLPGTHKSVPVSLVSIFLSANTPTNIWLLPSHRESRVWVGVCIHKRVVLVMQIRERVGNRKRNRAKKR